MSKFDDLVQAFVLHRRPFQDTSLLVDLFTRNYGRKTILARGARKTRSSGNASLLSPFIPLVVSFYGKSEILNLKKVEADGLCYNLSGTNLLLGFYLNELLVKLLHKDEAHQNIYSIYEKTLAEIATFQEDNFKQQLALRTFELELIKELGYGLELRFDALGKEIMPDLFYRYDFGIGFMPIKSSSDHSANTFSGSSLKALSAHALSNITEFREIKRLMQHIIAVLLNGKTIKTREIFRKDVYCATSID